MKLTSEIKKLVLKYPFRIARGSKEGRKEVESVFVTLEHDGVKGIGEICPSAYYYNETNEIAQKVVKEAEHVVGGNPFLIEDILSELRQRFHYAPATVAGIDMALYDLVCKLLGVPLYKYLGLNPAKMPATSYTIAIDTIPVMLKKLKEAGEYPIFKIKVGTPDDIEMVKAIRDNTDAVIRLDANTGWGTPEKAIDMINTLEKYDIEFVEQPIPPGNYNGMLKIKNNVNVPVMADEDVIDSKNIHGIAGCFDSINIKLMKCGGIHEALKMISVARSHGLKIMIGCMIESSLGNAAGSHLAPLVDFIDLDTHLLLETDPFTGLGNKKGVPVLSSMPGLGIVPGSRN